MVILITEIHPLSYRPKVDKSLIPEHIHLELKYFHTNIY